MKRANYIVLLAAAVLVAAAVACSELSVASTPAVSNIRMATDESGKTFTNSYAPSEPFYVFADLNGLKQGSVVEARWYAVDAQGVDPNKEISTSQYSYESGITYVYFQLTTSDGGDWPIGSYRVDLYLDGAKVGEQGFIVQ